MRVFLYFDTIALGVDSACCKCCFNKKNRISDVVVGCAYSFAAGAKVQITAVSRLARGNNRSDDSLGDTVGCVLQRIADPFDAAQV